MVRQMQLFAALAIGFALLLVPFRPVYAADKDASKTVITIDGMHCEACAKKVARKLTAVTHVNKANVDAKASQASIHPKEEKTVSPKALWEAIEAAGYTPTKLEGPSGTFTEKPKT